MDMDYRGKRNPEYHIIRRTGQVLASEADEWWQLREILNAVRYAAETAMENVTVAQLCDGD